MSAYAPNEGAGQQLMSPALQQLWNKEHELQWAEKRLNAAMSERASSPSESIRNKQANDAEIEQLRARVSVLASQIQHQKAEMRNQEIALQQHQETIRVQSEEINRYHSRPSKYSSPTYRAPSEYISPQRQKQQQIPPSEYKHPPPQYNPGASGYNIPPQYHQPPERFAHGPYPYPPPQSSFIQPYGAILSSYQDVHADATYNPAQHRRPNRPLDLSQVNPDATKFGTKITPKESIRGADRGISWTSPNRNPGERNNGTPGNPDPESPSSQIAKLSIQGPVNVRAEVMTPPLRLTGPVTGSVRPDQVNTPNSSTSSSGISGIMVPRGPTTTPERTGSVISSKSRSVRAAGAPLLPPLTTSGRNSLDDFLTKKYCDYFDKALDFSYRHCNTPSSEKDANLPQETKERLMRLSTRTSAARLMGSQYTRYYLIAKFLIQWLQEELHDAEAFSALSPEIAAAIALARQKADEAPTEQIKWQYRKDVAAQYHRMGNLLEFNYHLTTIVHLKAMKLHQKVAPMMYMRTDGVEEDLHFLVMAAYQVGLKQMSDPHEYRLFWPRVNDAFSPTSMVAMNPELSDSQAQPFELANKRAVVKLGWSPQVMYRITGPTGLSSATTIVKSGVLVRYPEQPRW